jgi:hypothetical protein
VAASSTPSEIGVPPRWLWPFHFRASTRQLTFQAAWRLNRRLGPWPVWLVAGVLLGAGPGLIDYALGCAASRLLTAVLLAPVLVAAVAEDALGKCAAALGAAAIGHSTVFIALAALDPERLATLMPAGQAYWEESHQWIVTGVSREYDVSWWLPAHVQWLVAVGLFTYLSLGLATFWQGFYELDLMNCYVGQLMAHSHNPLLALSLGWHPWSLCRAVGFFFITFEVTSFSCARLTGVTLSTRRRRTGRWLVGLGFLVLDGLLKFFLLDTVRVTLAENLRP